ncbi:MAG: hypothetical protein ACI9OJ_000569 [Myxococcota bacterium]
MTSPDGIDAATLTSMFEALLAKHEVPIERVADGRLVFMAEAGGRPCDALIYCQDVETGDPEDDPVPMVLVEVAYFPHLIDITRDIYQSAASILMLLSPDVALGSIELDPEEPQLRIRVPLLISCDSKPASAMLMSTLVGALDSLDECVPILIDVLENGVHPAHAYVAARIGGADPETASDLERGRWLWLLEGAVAHYSQDEDPRLAELEPLLKRLAAA